MQVITTTQLRTNTKQLIQTLGKGKTIKLIHRSKIIGDIAPMIADKSVKTVGTKKTFSQSVKAAQKAFSVQAKKLPKSNKKLMETYYKQLLGKHGKSIS